MQVQFSRGTNYQQNFGALMLDKGAKEIIGKRIGSNSELLRKFNQMVNVQKQSPLDVKIFENDGTGNLMCIITEKKLPIVGNNIDLDRFKRAEIYESFYDKLVAFFSGNPIAFVEKMCRKADEIARIDRVMMTIR